jgi:RHS repeat-associated protein
VAAVGNSSLIGYYKAVVQTANDYYPFGMMMPGRKFSASSAASSYRYGFNGMELDDDVSDEGHAYTTEYRFYDPRIGRWFSMDPVDENNIDLSPYANNFNNPIANKDPDGDDPITAIIDAIVAFGMSAGEDYVTARINGMNHDDATDEVGWWSAIWEGVKTYGSSVLKPPGAGLAQKLYKFSKSKAGQVLVGTVDRMVTKVAAKTDAGGYDDEDGNFSIRNLVNSDELSRLLKESLADELEAQATAILSSKMNAKAAAANSGSTPSANGIVSPPAGSGTAIPGAPNKKSKSSAKSKGGVIYEVPKEHTKSGKPYIGKTTNFDKRKYANKDGRNRKKGKIICRYGPGQGQNAEQREIDKRDGIENLDNKINAKKQKKKKKK